MKCIRYIYENEQSTPVRVSDEEAFREVNRGIARYVPRSEWKRETRDVK